MNYASAYLESLPNIMEEYNSNDDKSSQLMELLTEILLAICCFIKSKGQCANFLLTNTLRNLTGHHQSQQDNRLLNPLKIIINQSFLPT